jgi:photosystem II stability/assembly factor-like uncharacterized protein
MENISKTIILILIFIAKASAQSPWVLENSNVTGAGKEVYSMVVTSPLNVWAVIWNQNSGVTTGNEYTKTIDGGATWVVDTIRQAINYKFSSLAAINKDTAWAAMFKTTSTGGDIFRTCDGGTTWTIPDASIYKSSTSFPDDIYFFDNKNGVCFGDAESGYFEIYTTSNSGTSWTRVPSANIPAPLSGESGPSDVLSVHNNNIWVGTNKGRILMSSDKGLTWSYGPAFGTSTTIGAIAFKDSLNGIVFGNGTNNYRKTTNGGNTWSIFSLTGSYSYGLGKSFMYVKNSAIKPGMYICGGNSGAYKFATYSTDDGATWTKLDTMYHSCFGFYNSSVGWTDAFASTVLVPNIYKLDPTTLSIQQYENNGIIQIYPNPNNGTFIIETSETTKQAMQIYDVNGNLILSQIISGKINIDASFLNEGVYNLSIISNKNVVNKRFVIVR